MRSAKALTLLAGTFLVAITQVIAKPSPIPGYEIGPVTWTIPNGTDGTFIKLQGTIQEVDAQLTRDHPHIKRDLVFDNSTDPVNAASDVSVVQAAGGPRGVPSQDWREHAWCPEPGCCGYADWKRANAYHILAGIDYLKKFKNEIGVEGPNRCGRVSCSYDSAIFMCNDHRTYLPVKNGKPLSVGAHKLAANCWWTEPGSYPPYSAILGQLFSDDNDKGELGYNIVVREDPC
ncbi:hypothetical protein BLS_007273 [Venturia inaequalis]|uniref:Uncharacterized protein n=1 Tax=Venturia inaequalis TaxID=5025 RepID=A0A8H3YNC7_VENIN|nr:hypothetical protein BLS_007273 [Venturia inaequalis]KAE9979498.1 hypothetical protein EG328_000825 [Venturia inaequalis]KAE9980372.1 hypothetical protein EG327_006582 [Venturia inaequalis]RDI83917.1 hypothetical protein Vi05172_g5929 [Venturia inaequalis]